MQRFVGALTLCAAVVGLGCGNGTTQPDRTVQLSIDGPDSVTFGALGSETQLTATVRVSDGAVPPVDWRSNLPGVANISTTGLLFSVGDGTATIVATVDDVSDSITAVVRQVPAQLRFASQPTHTSINTPFFFPIVVSVADSNDMAVSNASDPITIALGQNPTGATLLGTTTVNAFRGAAEFGDLTLDAAGSGLTLEASSLGLGTTSVPFDITAGPDVVNLSNVGGAEVGALLDGQSTTFMNDYAVLSTDSVVTAVLTHAVRGDEIVAFVEGRPPEILNDSMWSADPDTIQLTFREPLAISVTLWIVAEPFVDLRARALSQIATTSSVWAAERMGLDFDEVEIVDATGDPDASGLQRTTRCDQRTFAQSNIGTRADRINIYYVGVVDNGRDRGYSCNDVIFMADRSGHELLVHEIGHSLGLAHTDNNPGYDRTNVMHSASSTREYFTEGQVFRQHFDMLSGLSGIYGIRPNGLRRCSHSSVSDRCMELVLRLWSDGSFPPNR